MGQTNQPANLLDRIMRLERDLAEVRKRAGLGNAVSRGTFRFLDDTGAQRVFFGPIFYGADVTTGWIFSRANGTSVFELGGGSNTDQYWALRDEAGNIIVGDDAATGQGLATPYIPGQFSSMSTPSDTTTLGTFQLLQKSIWRKQHPKIRMTILAQVTSTTAELRVRVNTGPDVGAVILGPQTINNGFGYATYTPFAVPGAHNTEFEVDLEGRVASGAGQIGLRVLQVLGVQS